MGNAHVLAEAFIRDVLRPLQRDGRPFALLGFSIGARVAYEIARRMPPLRLYVAGRAAPHIGPPEAEGKPGSNPDFDDPADALRWVISQNWGSSVALEKIVKDAEDRNDTGSLWKYARPIMNDISLGNTVLRDEDTKGRPLLTRVSCRLRVYESSLDASWPPSVIGDGWDRYSAVPEALQKKAYTNLTHDELCSTAGKPLLEDVLADPLTLIQAHPLAAANIPG